MVQIDITKKDLINNLLPNNSKNTIGLGKSQSEEMLFANIEEFDNYMANKTQSGDKKQTDQNF